MLVTLAMMLTLALVSAYAKINFLLGISTGELLFMTLT